MKVIYDGDCPVCNSLKNFAEKQVSTEINIFIPFQSTEFEHRIPVVTEQAAKRALHTISTNGEIKQGASAVFEIMRSLPGIWKWIGYLFAFPPIAWMAEPFYRLFARNRKFIGRIYS